jgi:hypothetical protein
MKTSHHPKRRSSENGFAVLIVFVLLAILAGLAVSNHESLRRLKKEIALIERQQEKQFVAPRVSEGITNRAPGTSRETGKPGGSLADPKSQ